LGFSEELVLEISPRGTAAKFAAAAKFNIEPKLKYNNGTKSKWCIASPVFFQSVRGAFVHCEIAFQKLGYVSRVTFRPRNLVCGLFTY
jgi:hypothetical protein